MKVIIEKLMAVVAQRQSPVLDMLNNHPKRSETLKAGEEAILMVSFDPIYHGPEGIGVQRKVIRITTGDIRKPSAEMRITATVVDQPGRVSVPGSPNAGTRGRKGHH
jgi:hypothetical protein